MRFAPGNIAARRDLMEYCAEAPWIVGGDKEKAKQQIEAIAAIDPIEGRLARAAYLRVEKQWRPAETEYLAVLGSAPHPHRSIYGGRRIFCRSQRRNESRTNNDDDAVRVDSRDARVGFYRAVVLVLRGGDANRAEQLLKSYVSSVPEKSDFPSHKSAMNWLARISR